jgi:serine/threonine-protein kinase
MGVVYKVEHVQMGKLMAVKLLHGELARDRQVVKRFKREATAVSRLTHPNTVQVFDFGRADGLMYLVMEFVDGRELARLVREDGPLSFERCAAVAVQICASLAEAHDCGVVHRDLKPENVLLRPSRYHGELVKVLDFGLAKLRAGDDRGDVTGHGVLVGTPHYMAPEQIEARAVDHRTDIYALGALIYRVLTGAPPFPAASPIAVLTRHLNDPAPSLHDSRPDLDFPELAEQLVARCLSKNPDERFQSVDEIRALLSEQAGLSGSAEIRSSQSGAVATRGELGLATTPPGGALPSATGVTIMVGRRELPISSKGEFERFELSLRRRRLLSWLTIALVGAVVVAGAVSYGLYEMRLPAVRQLRYEWWPVDSVAEDEPNNEPQQAQFMPLDTPLRGLVGQRVSRIQSDQDWFWVHNNGAQDRVLTARLEGVPRMDVVLQAVVFYRNGHRILAEANQGGPGEPEVIPGIAVRQRRIHLLVREAWVTGRAPTENVSDRYQLTARLHPPEAVEGEPNEHRLGATRLSLSQRLQGAIGRAGDVDWYCLGQHVPLTPSLQVELTSPEVALLMSPADGAPLPPADRQRLVLTEARCFVLRAQDPTLGAPGLPYFIRVIRAPAAAPPP